MDMEHEIKTSAPSEDSSPIPVDLVAGLHEAISIARDRASHAGSPSRMLKWDDLRTGLYFFIEAALPDLLKAKYQEGFTKGYQRGRDKQGYIENPLGIVEMPMQVRMSNTDVDDMAFGYAPTGAIGELRELIRMVEARTVESMNKGI